MENSTQPITTRHTTPMLTLNQSAQFDSQQLEISNSPDVQDFAQNGNYDRNEQIFQDAVNFFSGNTQRFEENKENTEIIRKEAPLQGNLPLPKDFKKPIISSCSELIVKTLKIYQNSSFSTTGSEYKKMKVQALKNGVIFDSFVYFYKENWHDLNNFRPKRVYTLYECSPLPKLDPLSESQNYEYTKYSDHEVHQDEKNFLMIFNALSNYEPNKEITFTRAKVSLCKRGEKYSITYRACGKIGCGKSLKEIDGKLVCLKCRNKNPSVTYRFVFDIMIQPLIKDAAQVQLPKSLIATVWDIQATTIMGYNAEDFQILDAISQEIVIKSVESKQYHVDVVLANERSEKPEVGYIVPL